MKPREMTDEAIIAGFCRWMREQPKQIRALAKEFPLGTVIGGGDEEAHILGWTAYVIGWAEDDKLIISPVWLGDDYDEAMKRRRYLHAGYVRGGLLTATLAPQEPGRPLPSDDKSLE